jgi:PAS domain S-box-containing protein
MNQNDKPSSTTIQYLAGGGEMGERTRTFDWSRTPVGPIADWPQSLRIAVHIMLNSRYAMWMGWGAEFTFFYNDAYAQMTLGPKHPWALGRSAREVWSEIWGDIGPRAESVVRTGTATWDERLLLFLERRGFKEESYHTFSYSPLPDDQGGIGGMLCVVTEDTERTIGERRLRALRELAARTTAAAKSADEACQTAARVLAENPHDLPFALIYLLDNDAGTVHLVGTAGLAASAAAAPLSMQLTGDTVWPFRATIESGHAEVIGDLDRRFGTLHCGPWPDPVLQAVIVPLAKPGQSAPAGFLVAGVSPRLELNDDYKGFLELVAGHVATAVANARAYEEERRRAEALAELDRAKTAFFSNVSHEFRTPLTLMLGPVEDLLARSYTELSPASKGQLEIVNRNGVRLLRLVNTLLDFSRIEAGRIRAVFQPTDLAVFTADLASVFRSAVERAGLRLIVDCPKLSEPVYVDRDMWEKVVLNLLSNAVKFTFDGQIVVALRRVGQRVELRVQDTGTGIPAEEMPRLFERFHRIENARARTHEGSGIGLALVHELVKLHGGSITAESVPGQGTTFIVSVPLGSAHLPADQIREGRAMTSTATGAAPYVEETLRWLPDEAPIGDDRRELPSFYEPVPSSYQPQQNANDDRPRVLVADDNADMRQYVVRLLAEHYRTEVVPDGEAALAKAREQPPDLVLTDVMMPRLDGFQLLRELRSDSRTRHVPVIMLSARAGEESRVEGLEAGADDYLVKPFGARELSARVSAHLQMARMRKEASAAIQKERDWLSVTLTSIGDAVITTDTEGRVTFLNGVAELLTGWANADAVGHPLDDVFHIVNEETRQPVENPATRALRDGVIVGLANHTVLVAKDGIERPIDDSAAPVRDAQGQVVGGVLVFRDITARRQAEKALRESERRWRIMAGALPNLLWTDLPNGQCDWLSSQCEQYTGIPENELLGIRWLETLHPDDRQRTLACWQAACADQGDYDLEYRIRRHDGEYHWFKTRGVPIRDDQGRIVYWFGSCTDIEEHKRMEEALREADRRKDEFLATLAHELRNPLAPIRNGLQLMKLARDDAAVVDQARTLMERQLLQLVRLVDDLMDVSRITRGKIELRKERTELAKIIEHAVETSRPLINEHNQDLTIQMPPGVIPMEGDVTRLAQVFANLLNNAAKYTERRGRIILTVERQGGEVRVSVKDTGIGIPPEMLPQLFQMFTQVDRSLDRAQGGLGIGLWLVRQLVEMHGGSVEVHSDGVGKGSEFVVRLPIAVPPDGTESAQGPDSLSTAITQRRILVVDDNEDSALSLAMMLQCMGNETATAHNGFDALKLAPTFRPQLIFLDIGMPKLNGHETARRIRQEPWGRDTVLVALTGWGQEEDKRRSEEAGFNLHIVKPVDLGVLEKLLERL